MVLKITGNRESFQLSGKIEFLDISIVEEENLLHPKIVFDDKTLKFPDKLHFLEFGKRLRGSFQTTFPLALQEFNIDPEIVQQFYRKTQTELSMFKSIFMIYDWAGLGLRNLYTTNLTARIYDSFIVDYFTRQDAQTDLYFIKEGLISKINEPIIRKLMEINLLNRAEFNDHLLGNYISYFVPLIKPGISREHFESDSDPSGNRAYSLWKTILKDRDVRISNWSTNRY